MGLESSDAAVPGQALHRQGRGGGPHRSARGMGLTRQAGRVTRAQPGGARRRTGGRYRSAWSGDTAEPQGRFVPAYAQLSEAPEDLLMRAAREKLPWIQRFVQEGSPWGRLRRYAEAYAEAAGILREQMPPYSTLNTWAHRYKEYGLLGLVDRVRSNAGELRAVSAEQEQLVEIALFGGKGTASTITELLASQARPGESVPSYETVRRTVRRMERRDPHLAAIARHGLLWWRNHHRLALTNGVLPGGYRFAVDSTVADVWIRVRDLSVPGGWRPVRPVLSVVEDVGTRLLVAFNLSLVAIDSGIIKGTFLRACNQDVQNEVHPGLISPGVPFEISLDQGSEHRARFRELLTALRVEVVNERNNEPESHAHIERLIKTITFGLFRALPGYSETQKPFDPYAPAETDAKRRITSLRYDPYRLELPISGLLTIDELEERLLAWAVAYNDAPHAGLPGESAALQAMIRSSLRARGINESPDVAEGF